MNIRSSDNHYLLLGIDMSAETKTVREALARLAEEADALAYLSPLQSRELWTTIRRIKEDLLSGNERRYAYDRSLLAIQVGGTPPESPRTPLVTPPKVRVRPVRPVAKEPRRHLGAVLLAGPVAVSALALGVAALYERNHGGITPTVTVPRRVALVDPTDGSKVPSDSLVRLQWDTIPNATEYRIQIGTSPMGSNANADPHWRTHVLTTTSFYLRVFGPRVYYWRVSALIHGVWSHFQTVARHFLVTMPSIAAPHALFPRDGSVVTPGQVKLCWSTVPGAEGYHFRIRGIGGMNVQGTCATHELAPGRYRWTVAARVRGTRVFIGAYTPHMYFTVRSELIATRRVRHGGAVREVALRGAPVPVTVMFRGAGSAARTAQSSSSSGQIRFVAAAATTATASHPRLGRARTIRRIANIPVVRLNPVTPVHRTPTSPRVPAPVTSPRFPAQVAPAPAAPPPPPPAPVPYNLVAPGRTAPPPVPPPAPAPAPSIVQSPRVAEPVRSVFETTPAPSSSASNQQNSRCGGRESC